MGLPSEARDLLMEMLASVLELGSVYDRADGTGKLHVDDTIWKATGPDLPAGSRVRVTGLDGTVLTLEPADNE